MKNSYFVLVSDKIDYPLYVAFLGFVSVDMLRERDVLWTVVRHLTQLDYNDFMLVDYCSRKNYNDALIKIDFTHKKQ